ncbi:MAG: hypothetical protein KJO60_14975 [Desulfofustis sp.]|nr:hypothetical protein [Desulfofustis sp.]MBT8355829.1 hypothetical protein [Desulfofustis sp.]NNK58274.1 hypothetical protein [Desulfofustis sp.]
MNYSAIDHLLLNLNKGLDAANPPGILSPGAVMPGDSVVVSVGDRELLNILVHRDIADSQTLVGETVGNVLDEDGREIIGTGAGVCFSYQKVAGIHRR